VLYEVLIWTVQNSVFLVRQNEPHMANYHLMTVQYSFCILMTVWRVTIDVWTSCYWS